MPTLRACVRCAGSGYLTRAMAVLEWRCQLCAASPSAAVSCGFIGWVALSAWNYRAAGCVLRGVGAHAGVPLTSSALQCLQLVVLSSLGVLCFSYVYLPGLGGATRRRAEAWGWQQWLVLLLPLGCVATCLVAFWRLCHHARAPSPAGGCCSAAV